MLKIGAFTSMLITNFSLICEIGINLVIDNFIKAQETAISLIIKCELL